MQTFTAFEYLLIDAANAYGHDKIIFNERIDWAKSVLNDLEDLIPDADNIPLFVKAVMAIRKAQAHVPTGHMVGFDASCSGMQIMSALTGCVAGATATGLVDPNKRTDAYTECTGLMNTILASSGASVLVPRSDAKKALMTSFYGSKAQPKKIFGEDTPELAAFYQAAQTIAPGAWELLQDLLGSWQGYALEHSWKLPDGFDAKVKVMKRIDGDAARIEVDELDHATFTYEYYVNEGLPVGHARAKSNVANVVHSIDAYLLRSIHRRCNYDADHTGYVAECVASELTLRALAGFNQGVADEFINEKIHYYLTLWEETGMVDVVVLPYLDQATVSCFPTEYLKKLEEILEGMLAYKPFEVVTIHDEFKCHPNHMNHLRQQYINIMAELAESTVLDFIFSTIMGVEVTYPKLSQDLGTKIRGSNYALC